MSGRILAIRLQAMGDVVITLPYLNDVKKRHPDVEIDLLTRQETEAIPRSLGLFSRVYAIGGGRRFKRQLLHTLALLPRLALRSYDIVLDLQDNEISRFVTRALRPHVWSRFDKKSPLPAGERTRLAIDRAGLGPVALDTDLPRRHHPRAERLLELSGFRHAPSLVVLNPAGAFPSRNWPLERYVAFAREWQRRREVPSQFLLLGLESLREKAARLRSELREDLLDLVGRTTPDEAFALVRRAELVLSEDSGLMHMAWVSGVPTLALFGSSRGDWSRPLGPRSLCLDSSDLECGFCMEFECPFGDIYCLTRRDPKEVAELALTLIEGR